MSTPGRRRALRALAAAKERNLHRVAEGDAPVVAGKKVSAKSIGMSRKKAKRILGAR